MGFNESFVLAASNDEDKAVPVEVKMVVWVKRQGWQEEYSIDPTEEDYDFEEAVQEWVKDEVQEYGVEGGNWDNVTEVTL
jgi:hypothetical protein